MRNVESPHYMFDYDKPLCVDSCASQHTSEIGQMSAALEAPVEQLLLPTGEMGTARASRPGTCGLRCVDTMDISTGFHRGNRYDSDTVVLRWNEYFTDHNIIKIAGLCCLGATCTISRVYLVVEAFISLRRVPIEAYQIPNWTQWVPHL